MNSICRVILLPALVHGMAFAQTYSITTIAGRDRLRNGSPAVTVPLGNPSGVVSDRKGNIFIADYHDNYVRRVDAAGTTSTYAGNGTCGHSGDGGPADRASICNPMALTIDPAGNLLIADGEFNLVKKVTPAGLISTLATTDQLFPEPDAVASAPGLDSPSAVATDASGNVYVAVITVAMRLNGTSYEFWVASKIKMIDASGRIKTVAGQAMGDTGDGGPATSARIGTINGIAVDSAGSIYLADFTNHRVRKIKPDGTINTVAGTGQAVYDGDGRLATASAVNPAAIVVDDLFNVYVADYRNHRVRRIDAKTGLMSTIAGTGVMGYSGDGGPATAARLASPAAVWIDPAGRILVAEWGNARVRSISLDGTIRTVAGTGVGDGGPATAAFLKHPHSVSADASGAVFVADACDNLIRAVATSGEISAVAGDGYRGDVSAVKANAARLANPQGVATDDAGNLYIADSRNYRLRKVTNSGDLVSLAGTGQKGDSPGGQASISQVGELVGVSLDGAGNLYVSDYSFNRIRKITPSGVMTNVAGNGKYSYAGDGGPATAAQFDPADVVSDKNGVLYIADVSNHRIRKVDANGTITTFAGDGTKGFAGDGGQATSARLSYPSGVTLDAAGNLYIADGGNHRVRRVTPAGVISTIAGNGLIDWSGDGGPALQAGMDPDHVFADAWGGILIADYSNHRVRRIVPNVAAEIRVSAGSGQTGAPGQALPEALKVRIVDGNGIPVAGVKVTFKVTSGQATLDPAEAVTDADGVASTVAVLLGNLSGEVTVTATVGSLPAATFTLRVNVPGPVIRPAGVVGAGMSVPPVRTLSPNGLMVVQGSVFAPQGTSVQAGPGDLVEGILPTLLVGACVLVGGTRAPLVSVSADSITFVAPAMDVQDAVEVRVAANCGSANELRSNADPLPYRAAAPEFLYWIQAPDGRNPVMARKMETSEAVGPAAAIGAQESVPARPDDWIVVYAVGLGVTDPAVIPGASPADRAAITGGIEVTLGGRPVPAANIGYAGVLPGTAGLYMLELRVPEDASDGELTLTIAAGGVPSPADGYLLVRR